MASEIAERYAQGLFELAIENGTVAEKKEQAEVLLHVLNADDDLSAFLRAVKITKQQKKEVLDTVFAGKMDQDMCNFLKLLVDKGRINYLRGILEEFGKLANERLGIEKASVSSARPLKEEDMEKIRQALVQKYGREVILENRIDPELIAGIKVTVGNTVTDVTMKNKIDALRDLLLKGGRA